jgi:hypothetical protein
VPAFEKSIQSLPPEWLAIIRQEGLRLAGLQKVHLVSPPNQPRRFKAAAACLPSRSSFGLPPEWPTINRQEGLWLACLQKVHLISPPEWLAIS